MSQKVKLNFTVYEKEPVVRLLKALKLTPVKLGIVFFVFISLTLCLWGAISSSVPADSNARYVPFFRNISWSLSILFLFPFVVALTFKYYEEVPSLFEHLFSEIAVGPNNDNDIKKFTDWLYRRFNSYILQIIFLIITLVLNYVYFWQLLNNQAFTDWMIDGHLLESLFNTRRGLTPVGLYAAIIQVVLIYWVLNLLWRGAVVAWGLNEFFNNRGFQIKIDPLHPDGVGGLGRIGRVVMVLNLTLFLLGIYVSLKVIDRIIIQQSSLGADIGNPIMLGGYAIIVPLLFFSPLGAAHKKMLVAKEEFIRPISQHCEELFSQLRRVSLNGNGRETIQTFIELEKIRDDMIRRVPVWPFDFKSIQAFFGTVVVPVLPIILPFLSQLIRHYF